MANNEVGQVVNEIVAVYEQGNVDIEKALEQSGERRKEIEKKIGEALSKTAEAACEQIGISYGDISNIIANPATAGVSAAADAIIGAGKAAVGTASELDTVMDQFVITTGAGEEEAQRYQAILEEVYKNNYGDSFADIADAMAELTAIGGTEEWSDAGIQEILESAFFLRDTFAYDVADSMQAAKTLMDSFGVDGSKAMSLIAEGARNGLDSSGELLDSISAYSAQFSEIGMNADDMFQIFQAGAQTGAFELGTVGEAIGEMSARLKDGSEEATEGFEILGLNAEEMTEKFMVGGDSAREAFQQTVDALAGMEDPIAQNTAGLDLFGTAWEELGPEAVDALAGIEEGIYAVGDEMESLQELGGDNLGAQLEELQRNVEMLLVPLGEQLIPILSQIMEEILPPLMEILQPLVELVGAILEPLLTLVSEVLTPIMEIVASLIEPLTELMESCLTPLFDLIQGLLEPLLQLVETCLTPLLDMVLQLLDPLFQFISEILPPLTELFAGLLEPVITLVETALRPFLDILQPIVDAISLMMIPALGSLMNKFDEVFTNVSEFVSRHMGNVMAVLENVIDFIKNVFTGNWEEAWENVKNIFSAIADSLGSIFKPPVNAIIDVLNGFIRGINKIQIPDWIPAIGGKGFHIPEIPRLKEGEDFIPRDWYAAYLDHGERVMTASENAKFNAMGGLEGMERALSMDRFAAGEKKITVIVPVDIDGREVARSTAEYIGEQQYWEDL